LHRVKGIDTDTSAEDRSEHQPTHRWVAKSIVERGPGNGPHFLQNGPALSGGEADVMHRDECNQEGEAQRNGPQEIGYTEMGDLSDRTASQSTRQHRNATSDLPLGKRGLQGALVSREPERIDEPSFGSPGEERKTETKQHRDDRPSP